MKTNLLCLCTLAMLAFSGNAQIIEDDFESYNLGDMGCQNPTVWATWSGVCDDGSNIAVVDDIVHEGTKAGYIGPDSVQDCVLLLGNRTTSAYTLAYYMYITGGSTAYLNIQGEIVTLPPAGGNGVFNSSNMYFNNAGAAPGVFEDQTTGETGTYPEDAWFPVSIYFDMMSTPPTYVITLNNGVVNGNPVPFQADETLGGIDFFSIDANNNYWLDDLLFVEGLIVGIDEFSAKNFKLYPNPVTDVLHIQSVAVISNIEIYSMLSKQVLETSRNAISPSLDMSALHSGVYLVSVTIDGTSKTFKVVK